MHSAEILFTAQFYDLDPMGVVWHGNYARFLEQARCALLDRIGYNYDAMAQSGYLWPIVDLRIKYVRPIRFGQQCRVRANIVDFENGLRIDYRIRDEAGGEVLTKARSLQVAVDAATGEMLLASPDILTAKLR